MEALVGTGVARSMSVKVGDGLTILAVTADGALNGIDVQIVGIVNTGFKDLDDRYLRITLPSAQRLLQTDRVTNLVVGLDETENTDAVAAMACSTTERPFATDGAFASGSTWRRTTSRCGRCFSGIFLFPGRHRVLHGADGECEHAADGDV